MQRNITKNEDVQSLVILNSTFTNILYEIGSIVRLPENPKPNTTEQATPWKLNITNSIFTKMSFCGSIVSNDFPTFEGTPNNTIQIYNNVQKNQI